MTLNDFPSYLIPLLAAAVAGGLIGLEREWRGRAAGFRTHILVSLSSALLMLMAVGQGDWAFEAIPGEQLVTDPVRMAHGVLTGIGFLCAGVIFRTGFSIHGLTTAASVWMTAAIGLIFGVGLYGMGATATGLTLAILVGLRLVSLKLPERRVLDVTVSWRRGEATPEAAVEAALRSVDGHVQPDKVELVDEGSVVRRSWRLKTASTEDLTMLGERLAALAGVIGFKLNPRDT